MDSHKVVTHQGQSREGESPLLDRRKDSFSCTRSCYLVARLDSRVGRQEILVHPRKHCYVTRKVDR